MQERISRFVKNFFAALAHCSLEDFPFGDADGHGSIFATVLGCVALLVTSVLVCAGVIALVYGFVQVTYELMFDPNSHDVAARLFGLSITRTNRM
ncbi:MAG TPA: hypothetical protein VFA90_16810 [Terriglobales bacterium]|nr:hypothetical protein [Terriglobales bacterium]